MTKKLHCIFLLITILGLVSCTSIQGFPDRVVDADVELAELKTDFEAAKKVYNTTTDDTIRKRIRNEILNGRIAAIDIQFSQFQQELHEQGVGLNIGTDAITLGLGAAGALASGGTSQILSAASGALTGLKGSVNKNAFYEQAMPALFAQMIAKRKAVLVNIRTGLLQSPTLYPLQQGLADLEDYRYAGTIPGAISAVVENAGSESTQANKELSEIVATGFEVTDDTLALKQWLKPGGVRNRDRWNILQNWLKENNINMSVASFMDAPEMRDQIKKFLNSSNLVENESTGVSEPLSTVLKSHPIKQFSTIDPVPNINPEEPDDILVLKQWLKPNGIRNRDRWNILRNWLIANKINMSVASFMDDPEMRGERKQFFDFLAHGTTQPDQQPPPDVSTSHKNTADTLVLEQWLKPGGVRNRERWNILQNWLNTNNINMSVTSFIDAPEMADQIKQAVDLINQGLMK